MEDSRKVGEQEKQLGRFKCSWLTRDGSLPNASFTLSLEEVSLANDRLKQVRVPTGFDWNTQPFFSKPSTMKSHQWKQVAIHGVLKYCLRGLLGKTQQQTLFQFFDILTRLYAKELHPSMVCSLETEVHKGLVLIERDFPLSLQVIVFHLLNHLPTFITWFGPVYSFWMYQFERFNSWICRRILNRRFPESAVVETYRLSEWAHFMELTEQLPDDTNITPAGSFLNVNGLEDLGSSAVYEEYELSRDQAASVAADITKV